MRIPEIYRTGISYIRPSSEKPNQTGSVSQPGEDRISFQRAGVMTLPQMLELTSSDHPNRASFLTALSESLRAGLHVTNPADVASSMLQRGFDSLDGDA